MTVRVRFAPSPTGALHLGSARTVLFNYLFARKLGGTFVLRIEDTDRARFGENSLESIIDGMRWLGLQWDEGPEVGGPHAPYFQSERLAIYREQVDRLVGTGDAYLCFCTRERLDALREQQNREKRPSRYDRHCLALSPDEVSRRVVTGEPHVVRMRLPPGTTTVEDAVRGPLEFDNSSQDDQVILKSDGFPTYHLASTVDDHLMEISHVIRGDEWLASSPKQVLLYRMLGWQPPVFVHLPLVLGPDKAKLSKRHGAASVLEYRDLGYLPGAMANFLALLGWAPPAEDDFLTLAALTAAFDISRVQVSPAVFDQAKLDSVNGRHIRAMDPGELAVALRPFVPSLSVSLLEEVAPLVQERIQRLTDAAPLLEFFVERPQELGAELLPQRKGVDPAALREEGIKVLQETRELFAAGPVGPGLDESLRSLAATYGWKTGEIFMMIRVGLTGSRVTPPLLESAAILGKSECLVRLDHAIGQLIAAGRG
ncbi:MAG: glutamate--tRNA ligase [Candidatus Dormibacteria bacterium]